MLVIITAAPTRCRKSAALLLFRGIDGGDAVVKLLLQRRGGLRTLCWIGVKHALDRSTTVRGMPFSVREAYTPLSCFCPISSCVPSNGSLPVNVKPERYLPNE